MLMLRYLSMCIEAQQALRYNEAEDKMKEIQTFAMSMQVHRKEYICVY